MNVPLKLMAVLAHPDDESLGAGGTLARYAEEGVEVHLLTATRGESGRFGDAKERPPREVVGQVRENELRCAAETLGVKEIAFLDYIDGHLDEAEPMEAIARITAHLRRVRPHVVITFGPEGGYGHPDHIAISQFTTAATLAAADPDFRLNGSDPLKSKSHRVSKLYYMAWDADKWAAYQAAFRTLVSRVDNVERQASPWPDWEITTQIDTSAHWATVWKAIQCHKTQLTIYKKLGELSEEYHRSLWGTQQYYRAFSLVNGGRKREDDLFAGLR